jgi:hypothetical protein
VVFKDWAYNEYCKIDFYFNRKKKAKEVKDMDIGLLRVGQIVRMRLTKERVMVVYIGYGIHPFISIRCANYETHSVNPEELEDVNMEGLTWER